MRRCNRTKTICDDGEGKNVQHFNFIASVPTLPKTSYHCHYQHICVCAGDGEGQPHLPQRRHDTTKHTTVEYNTEHTHAHHIAHAMGHAASMWPNDTCNYHPNAVIGKDALCATVNANTSEYRSGVEYVSVLAAAQSTTLPLAAPSFARPIRKRITRGRKC